MEDGYNTDDVLSQALDLCEEQHVQVSSHTTYSVETEPISDDWEESYHQHSPCEDKIEQALSLTQSKYTVETEPISDEDPIASMLNILRDQNADVTDTQMGAIRDAVDVSDMMDKGGPCQVGMRKPMKRKEESQSVSTTGTASQSDVTSKTSNEKGKRFANVTEVELSERKKPFVPKNTLKKNKWSFNIFKKWRSEFIQTEENGRGDKKEIYDLLFDTDRDLQDFSCTELNTILPAFVIALRKEDGSEYKGESVLSIMCGLQRYVNSFGYRMDFFNDDTFNTLKITIDTTMQDKCARGVGLQRRQAMIITPESEAILWSKGLLGIRTPQTLLDTVFWVNGIHFGLRGGDEHRKLSFNNFMVKVDSDGHRYLEYTESVSKTYRGGLKHRNTDPHTARAYQDTTNPCQCPVAIHEEYIRRLPPNKNPDLFYFRPLQKPKSDIWFTCSPVGHNNLETTVKRLMKQAGIEGYFTNHSLRASTATRLFQAGLSEQIIREQTGHRSIAVEAYKRTSDKQKREVSEVLKNENASKRARVQQEPVDSGTTVESGPATYLQCQNVTINNFYKS